MDNFHQGLDSRIQDRLDKIFPPPDNLDDLARLAVRLDRHMIQQIKRKNKSQHHSLGRNNNKHNPSSNNLTDNNNEHSNHVRCSYCKRVGHSEDNCYKHQNDIRRQQNSSIKASTISPEVNKNSNSGPVLSFILKEGSEIPLNCFIDTGAFSVSLIKRLLMIIKLHTMKTQKFPSSMK